MKSIDKIITRQKLQMMENKNLIEDFQKINFILGCDYSNYPQPLKGLLEKRKQVYKTCYNNYQQEDLKQLIAHIEDKIKLILLL